MNTNNILQSDVLDIIFFNRNKAYGAYMLRRYYPQRIKMALALVLAAASFFALLVLVPAKAGRHYAAPIPHETKFIQLAPDKPEPPKLHQSHQPPAGNTQAFNSRIWIADKADSAEKIKDISDRFIGSINFYGDAPFTDEPVKIQNDVPVIAPVKVQTDEPVSEPEIQPAYPGGMAAFRRFLEQHLKTPADMEEGATVQVCIKCVIGFDGLLRNFEVLQDGGRPFNEEVIRVLKKMPRWIPGKSGGRDVAAWHIIPVKFVSQD